MRPDFDVPRTPESRTPAVLLGLGIVGGLAAAWRAFAGLAFAVEIASGVLIAALAYAVLRYAARRRAPR